MASNFALMPAHGYCPENVRYFPVQASQTFITGALVVYDQTTNKTISECGADPATILGIALAPASVGLASAGSIYGGTNIPVLIITPDMVMKIGSSTTYVQATHQGNSYGVVKSTNWLLDISDTTATRAYVVDGSTSPEFFYVRLLAANLQMDAIAS